MKSLLHEVELSLSSLYKTSCKVLSTRVLSGSSTSSVLKVETTCGIFFLKYGNQSDLYVKEEDGLLALDRMSPISCPEIILRRKGFIILEYIHQKEKDPLYWSYFGANLAKQHQVEGSYYGWSQDNYIGALPQNNTHYHDWISFFIEMRLHPNFQLALNRGLISSQEEEHFQKLYTKLPNILPKNPPSLLHGDLWHGNVLTGKNGHAITIDPAVYFGSREIEIAFTILFGGFSNLFYEAYNDVYPLEPNFKQRIDIYHLYPLLVHLNIFGKSYYSPIISILRKYS